MINGGDLYNVLSAVVPLYVAMILAYGSVRWWKILTPEQCGGINRFVSVFAVPLLSFKFIARNNPYKMDMPFIAADALSKVVILGLLALWAKYSKRGSFDWMITLFMLATLPNTLVMGIPLLKAMYGPDAGSLVVQAVVMQCILWYTLLLFFYEYRAARTLIMEQFPETAASIVSFKVDSDVTSLDGRDPVQADAVVGEDGKLHVQVRKSVSSSQGLGLDHLHSSRRSQGLLSMPSSKALTPRPSNLTGAEIYSLHSSVNLTPRESSFNHTDFYSMLSGRAGSPRHSNFTSSDVYSLHSSRGPTPRTSNFNEENSKDLHAYARGTSPHTRFPPPVYHASGHVFGRNHAGGFEGSHIGVVPRGGPYPGQGFPATNVGVYSPTPSQITKKVVEPKEPKAPSKLEDETAKELHMFVWSSSASPVSEAGLHVFGNNEFAADETTRNETDAKEVRLLVRPQQETNGNANANANVVADRGGAEVTRQNYDEYVREDFSFGNSKGLDKDDFPDKDGPSLSKKFGSSSTTELTPKLVDDRKTSSLPPTHVMVKLIMDMVIRKLIRNPNTYSSLLGIIWSLVSFRWHVKMPLLIDNSISILSDAGLGMAMFSLGLFMALQGRLIACGPAVAVLAMAIRFITGPGAMAAASVAVGMRGTFLHASIVQAALPQGIVPFVFAKEYNLHPDILSTAVIFGMLVAFPITLLYYIILGV